MKGLKFSILRIEVVYKNDRERNTDFGSTRYFIIVPFDLCLN